MTYPTIATIPTRDVTVDFIAGASSAAGGRYASLRLARFFPIARLALTLFYQRTALLVSSDSRYTVRCYSRGAPRPGQTTLAACIIDKGSATALAASASPTPPRAARLFATSSGLVPNNMMSDILAITNTSRPSANPSAHTCPTCSTACVLQLLPSAPFPPASAAHTVNTAIGRSCPGAAHCPPDSHRHAMRPPSNCAAAQTMSHVAVVRPSTASAACLAVHAPISCPDPRADHRAPVPNFDTELRLSRPEFEPEPFV